MRWDSSFLKNFKTGSVIRIFLIACAFFSIFSATCQEVEKKIVKVFPAPNKLLIQFQLPEFEIADTILVNRYGSPEKFTYIRIQDDFETTGALGVPQLPQLTFDLQVPYNASDFKVELLSMDPSVINNIEKKIVPAQTENAICGVPTHSKNQFSGFFSNDNYANVSESQDDSYIQYNETFVVFGERGINVTVSPFMYHPEQENLTVISKAVFAVSYTLSGQDPEHYYSEAKDDYLSSLFENYENSGGYAPQKERYLIITPLEFDTVLTGFAHFKRDNGFEVQVVTTNTTGNTAASIKKYIQNQYNNISTRPAFVLLVGDVDKIPAYEGDASGKVEARPVSDLGYALLDGKDWFADVFLGRFSVADEKQLKNIIDKTIFMETNMHRFEKKAVFIAGDEKKGVWNRLYMKNSFKAGHEYVIRNSFIPVGYNCKRLYQPRKEEVINALNDNPLFYIYAGHGTPGSFAGISFDLTHKEIQSATNTVFPFVFSFACKTGNFAQKSIGEYFIGEKGKGAVAYFGSSVNSRTNTDPIIEKKIFGTAFKQEACHLSAMINLGMKRFANAAGIRNIRKEIYLKSYNLLGDPSFPLKK